MALCRELGVTTPEDMYPFWEGPRGPVVVAPLFLLYDYTFRTHPGLTREQALAAAHDKGIVCTDEFFLFPAPYTSRQEWCEHRVRETHHVECVAILEPVKKDS